MKRRTKLFLVVSALLISLFGTTMCVNAEELENVIQNYDELYYEQQEADENGHYTYNVIMDRFNNDALINSQLSEFTIITTNRIAFLKEITESTPSTINWKPYSISNQGMVINNAQAISVNLNTYDYVNGELSGTNTYTPSVFSLVSCRSDLYISFSTNIPVFTNQEDLENYLLNGNEDNIQNGKPELEVGFYLKDLQFSLRAEDSSEHPEQTFIKFMWSTDNLQEGDILEIKTHNYWRGLMGNEFSGYDDYLTAMQGVSAYSGQYEIMQLAPVLKWINSLENKPLVFRSYDTDTYYLRPVRGSIYGSWVKISMQRLTPTSPPFVSNIEYGHFDENGEWVYNDDITSEQGGKHGIDELGNITTPSDFNGMIQIENIGDLFNYFFSNIGNLLGMFGELPSLINATIGWLPSSIIVLICTSIAIVLIMRIFGR